MKIGLLEIGIIIAVILVIFGITRLSKMGQDSGKQYVRYTPEEEAAIREKRLALIAAQDAEDERIQQRRRVRGRMLGYILIGLGILAIFYLLFIIKWVATSPLWIWGVLVVVLGIVIVYLTRGKQ
jgi:Sec-independent protein translocase protein TatA